MRIRSFIGILGLIGTLAALSIALGSGRAAHAQIYGSPPPLPSQPPTEQQSAAPARVQRPATTRTAVPVIGKLATLVEEPLFELMAGVGILTTFASFLVWKARTARMPRAASLSASAGTATYAPPRPATAPRAGGRPLTPLADRFRSLSALRERERG